MKKIIIVMLSFVLLTTLALSGCNKAQKEIKAIGDELCADNGKNADGVVMNDAFAEFMGRMMYPMMKEMLGDEMTEDKFVEEMKKEMTGEKGSKTEFDSCSTEVETKKCEEVYKEIAGDEKMKEMKDAEKTIIAVGEKMGIKNCGVITAKIKEKGEDKEETGTLYVGEIGGEYKVFYAKEPK